MHRARVADGRALEFLERPEVAVPAPAPPVRLAFAAAHLAMEPDFASVEDADDQFAIASHVDWDATLELRRHLDRQGFGIAEAMDTAQRFDIGWELARELIRRTGALGLENGFVAGAAADHLADVGSREELADGVVHQARVIADAGGWAVLLPQPWLVEQGTDEAGYVAFYERVIEAAPAPLFVHWLGEMFHSGLAGYFPGESFQRVMALDPAKVRGAKLSLLDADLEVRLRRELRTRNQLLLTGDDWNFADLIAGGQDRIAEVEGQVEIGGRQVADGDFSHALLGIFDAIAIPAGRALHFLALGDRARYQAAMRPCEALGRHLFAAPTTYYKTGLAFLAWLDGRQPEFLLPGRLEGARDLEHLIEAARLAEEAGCFERPALVAERLEHYCMRTHP